MIAQQQRQLGQLLQYMAEALDIPEDLDRELTARYDDLGKWIREDSEDRFAADAEIYTQGSRRLGTLVQPVKREEDYDIDLVYLRHVQRRSVSQADLKAQIGEQLRRYCDQLRRREGGRISLFEKQRCWRIQFGDRYHMDVLPALPDDEAWTNNSAYHEHGIIITDKDLRLWRASNPKGYAEWFASRMATVLLEARESMAKAAQVDIEEVPDHAVRTPLHRVVQLLKRHRDIRYMGCPDDKPISIIITTLAAEAYGNQVDIYDALASVVQRMPQLIERRKGVYWVENPVVPGENFANKWSEHPERAERFFEWLAQVNADLGQAMEQRGIQKVAGVLGESFGSDVSTTAARRFGDSMLEARDARKLWVAPGSATLGSSGAMPVAGHTFYGDVHKD